MFGNPVYSQKFFKENERYVKLRIFSSEFKNKVYIERITKRRFLPNKKDVVLYAEYAVMVSIVDLIEKGTSDSTWFLEGWN